MIRAPAVRKAEMMGRDNRLHRNPRRRTASSRYSTATIKETCSTPAVHASAHDKLKTCQSMQVTQWAWSKPEESGVEGGVEGVCLNGSMVVDLLQVGVHRLVGVLIDVTPRNGFDQAIIQEQRDKRHRSQRLLIEIIAAHSPLTLAHQCKTRMQHTFRQLSLTAAD